jgi:hypothetical protein
VPTASQENDQYIFEVERILDKKVEEINGVKTTFYYIRWQDFGPEWDTWEPESNLIGTVISYLYSSK